MSAWTDEQAVERWNRVGYPKAECAGRTLLTLEAERDEAVRAKSALEVASGRALLAVIERAEKAEASVARLTAIVNETDKSRLYVGSTSRVITAMVERVVLAGESPDAVVADYRWEWDRGPDLQPIADLLAEVARMRAHIMVWYDQLTTRDLGAIQGEMREAVSPTAPILTADIRASMVALAEPEESAQGDRP